MKQGQRNGIGSHHRGWKGETNIWLTPPEIIHALGQFDLDPCACPDPRPWDTASQHYATDGLALPWTRRVWLNPPYGPETGFWLERLSQHGNGIAIVFARTETEMFHRWVWEKAHGILFLEGRLHFHRADGTRAKANAGGPSCLVAYGEENARALRECGLKGHFVSLEASNAPA